MSLLDPLKKKNEISTAYVFRKLSRTHTHIYTDRTLQFLQRLPAIVYILCIMFFRMATELANKKAEREALRGVIQQWNANRLDLFELSEPNEVSILQRLSTNTFFFFFIQRHHCSPGLFHLYFLFHRIWSFMA